MFQLQVQEGLRVISDQFGNLVFAGDVLKGAQDAFTRGRYVEAFALLHAEVDYLMESLCDVYEPFVFPRDLKDPVFQKSEQEFRFKRNASYLAGHRLISGKEHRQLLAFNEMRDRVIHRLVIFTHSHSESARLDKPEVQESFEEGMRLAKLLKEKRAAKVGADFQDYLKRTRPAKA